MKPNKDGRIEGITIPALVNLENNTEPVKRRKRSFVEMLISFLLKGTVRLLRPKKDDILVIVGKKQLSPEEIGRINNMALEAGLPVPILYLQGPVNVYAEPQAKWVDLAKSQFQEMARISS